MTIFRKLLILLSTLLVISTVPVACVNNPKIVAPVNSELEPRVQGRWDALIDKNFEQAYQYFSPAHRRLFPLQHYLSSTGSSVNWLSSEIIDIKINEERAEVKVRMVSTLDLPMGVGDDFGQFTKDLRETWLWVDGQWWYTDDGGGSLF